jgi:hypothetical protein
VIVDPTINTTMPSGGTSRVWKVEVVKVLLSEDDYGTISFSP